MNLQERLIAFSELGKKLDFIPENTKIQARNQNKWFTKESIEQAFKGIKSYLQSEKLENWIKNYPVLNTTPQKVAVVMAGNIPLVGFHDFLCVLMSGHILLARPSSEDNILIRAVADLLVEIEPKFAEYIYFVDKVNEADKVIATGSDNTARYFAYYFAKKPHIIRKNRVSIALLNGKESKEDLQALGEDIFSYFGLGCRNVAKLYVPKDYPFTDFFEAIESFAEVKNHHKYFNNYEYNKAIYLLKPIPHLDNGFVLLSESKEVASPVACLYYEYYENEWDLQEKIAIHKEKIQCIVSQNASWNNSYAFGQAQKPELSDYADGIDTIQFLVQ
ncbi:MAG: acyl-CoA reductase [Raineya sp.]